MANLFKLFIDLCNSLNQPVSKSVCCKAAFSRFVVIGHVSVISRLPLAVSKTAFSSLLFVPHFPWRRCSAHHAMDLSRLYRSPTSCTISTCDLWANTMLIRFPPAKSNVDRILLKTPIHRKTHMVAFRYRDSNTIRFEVEENQRLANWSRLIDRSLMSMWRNYRYDF